MKYSLCALFLFFVFNAGEVRGEEKRDPSRGGRKDSIGSSKKNYVLMPGPAGAEKIGDLKGKPGKGESIYKKYCVYCHGKKGYGDGMAAIALKPSPAVLNNSFMGWKQLGKEEYEKMEQRLFEIITYGSKGSPEFNMPAWGPVISREDRVHVLSNCKLITWLFSFLWA